MLTWSSQYFIAISFVVGACRSPDSLVLKTFERSSRYGWGDRRNKETVGNGRKRRIYNYSTTQIYPLPAFTFNTSVITKSQLPFGGFLLFHFLLPVFRYLIQVVSQVILEHSAQGRNWISSSPHSCCHNQGLIEPVGMFPMKPCAQTFC